MEIGSSQEIIGGGGTGVEPETLKSNPRTTSHLAE